uniref:hypothetical protein n=1 Tax=Bacillus pumilus TaxID=1408 RepID=UPI001C92C3BD
YGFGVGGFGVNGEKGFWSVVGGGYVVLDDMGFGSGVDVEVVVVVCWVLLREVKGGGHRVVGGVV